MSDTVLLRTRVPEARLREVEVVLKRLGLSPGDAVNMLLAQIELQRGLPFEVSLRDGPMLSPAQQGIEWNEAYGEY